MQTKLIYRNENLKKRRGEEIRDSEKRLKKLMMVDGRKGSLEIEVTLKAPISFRSMCKVP